MEALVFAAVYGAYHLTAFPSVPGGDSGELLAEACQLGVPHPPGYPLFTLLAHAVMKIPMVRFHLHPESLSLELDHSPSPAWKVNNLCAVLGALAAVFILKSSWTVLDAIEGPASGASGGGRAAATVGCALFAFSPLVWEYSVTAEVFALNNFLCALLLFLACRTLLLLAERGSARAVWASVVSGAFVSGLALANQHTSLLHATPLIFAVLVALWWQRFPKRWALLLCSLGAALLGLAPYVYLLVAARAPTYGSWGDTSSMTGLLRHMLRAEYGTFQLGFIRGSESWAERIRIYIAFTSEQSAHAAFPLLAAAGALCALDWLRGAPPAIAATTAITGRARRGKTASGAGPGAATLSASPASHGRSAALWLVACALVTWIFYTLVWHCVFSNLPLSAPMPFGVHARFWMQPAISLHVLVGAAAAGVHRQFCRSAQLPAGAARALEVGAAALAVALLAGARFGRLDHSASGVLLRQYAQATLAALPPRALLVSATDLDWNPVRYATICERSRGDASPLTHVSIQLLPYAWFPRQAALYANFTRPEMFTGVSTERQSAANAELLARVFDANGVPSHAATVRHQLRAGASAAEASQLRAFAERDPFPGGVFVDMQAVSEAHIGDAGRYQGRFTLLPWGTQFRVLPLLDAPVAEALQLQAAQALAAVQRHLPRATAALVARYPPGSWEFGALSVGQDASYQLGLHLLTYAMGLQAQLATQPTAQLLAVMVDRMAGAAELLSETFDAAHELGTLNSGLADLRKNTALVHLRLLAMLPALESEATERALRSFSTASPQTLLAAPRVLALCAPAGRRQAARRARAAIEEFLRRDPSDRDAAVFRRALAQTGTDTGND